MNLLPFIIVDINADVLDGNIKDVRLSSDERGVREAEEDVTVTDGTLHLCDQRRVLKKERPMKQQPHFPSFEF